MTRPTAATLLGQNVLKRCAVQGIDPSALVSRLGWSEKARAELKSGSLDIDLDQLDQLSAALDVPPHDLLAEVTIQEEQAQQLRYG